MNEINNSTGTSGGARSHVHLRDAVNLLNEAREVNEAIFMASNGLSDRQHRDVMQRLSAICGDTLKFVADNLEAIQTEGGAS